jgi:hypothetical protein
MAYRRTSARTYSNGFSLERLLAPPPPEGPPPAETSPPDDPLTLDCRGMELEPLLNLVVDSIDYEEEELFYQVLDDADRVRQEPERHPGTQEFIKDDDGQVVYKEHPFGYWIYGLQAGSFRLPVCTPREFLQEFLGRPWLTRRCARCLAWLPDQYQPSWTCPVCGGEDIEHKDISGNDQDGWDPP